MKMITGVKYPNRQNVGNISNVAPRPMSRALAPQSQQMQAAITPNDMEDMRNIHGGFTTSMTLNNVLSELAKLQEKSAAGKVELGLLPFSWLVSQAAETEVADQPPQNAVFENVMIKGVTNEDNISVELSFDIVVLKAGWTDLALAPSGIAVTAIDIEPVADTAQQDASKSGDSPPALASEPTVATTPLGVEVGSAASPASDHSKPEDVDLSTVEPCAYVAVLNSYYRLFNFGASRWRVKLTGMAPFASHQNRNFSLWIPEAICTKLLFTVPKSDVLITVENALEQSYDLDESKTTVTAILAPSNHVSLGWTDRVVEIPHMEDEEKEILEVVVTAEQHDTVKIGEVLLTHRYDWNLNIMNGPRFSFEIEIPEGLIIRNVTGSSIKSWEVTSGHKMSRTSSLRDLDQVAPEAAEPMVMMAPAPGSSDPIEGAPVLAVPLVAPPGAIVAEAVQGEISVAPTAGAEAHVVAGGPEDEPSSTATLSRRKDRRILRVYHQYGAEGNYQLSVTAETPLKEREGPISVLSCKMREVERETGFLAIEAPSNVEVNEKVISQLSRIDIQELPHFIRNRATTSILYAYKFLSPVWSASMDIKRHQDMDVLVAVIDEAWVCSTMVMEGRVQTKLELKVRNTTRQYLRIRLPQAAKIWSSEVNNNLVKPAHDTNGETIMIPLEKSSGYNQGKDYFWVDIVYIYEQKSMKGRGDIEITLPSFDLPANQFFVEFFLPKNFKYAEFEGDLKEVKRFSRDKSRAIDGASPSNWADQRFGGGGAAAYGGMPPEPQPMVQRMAMPMEDEVMSCEMDMPMPAAAPVPIMMASMAAPAPSVMPKMARVRKPAAPITQAVAPMGAKGTKPVRVNMVKEGKMFCFERLLTDQDQFRLKVAFAEIYEPWWKKRRVGFCSFM